MAKHDGRLMRTPLGHAYGLGSAKAGFHHWWVTRLTSVALIPLGIWFVIAVLGHARLDYAGMHGWLGRPFVAIAAILTVAVTFWHTALGMQVVFEDYIHHEGAKLAAVYAVKFLCVALAVAGIFAVLRVAFGA